MLTRRFTARLLRPGLTGVVLSALAIATAGSALADGPLDMVPADAGVVVRLKNPQAVIGKVGNFANQVQPGIGFLVQSQAPALGIAISNQTLGGVDLTQDWHVVVFPVKDGPPGVVFIVGASDVDALEAAVGKTFTFADKDKWVAYSQDEAAVERIQELMDGTGDSISSVMDRRSQGVFDKGDLSVYVNIAELTEIYADDLEGADEKIEAGIAGIAAQVPAQNGLNLGPILQIYGDVAKSFLQGVRDSDGFTFGLEVAEDSLNIEELVVVKKDTGTDKYLQQHTPGDLQILNRLPQGKHAYFALDVDFSSVAEWGVSVLETVSEAMKDTEQDDLKKVAEMIKQAHTAVKELENVEFGGLASAVSLEEAGKDEGILRGYTLTNVNPAKTMRELSRKFSSIGQMNFGTFKQEVKIEVDAEKYGDLSGDVIHITQEYGQEADPLGIQKEMQAVLYGPNGIVQRLVVTDDHVIQTIGGGQEEMKEAIAALEAEPPTSGLTEAQKSRAKLPEKANMIGLVDAPNMALIAIKVAAATGKVPFPIPVEQLKQVKLGESYMGFSIGTEAQAVRCSFQLPASTLKGFAQIVGAFRQGQQGGGF